MLYTGSFKDVDPDKYDQIWIIVRRLANNFKNPKNNIFYVYELAPSRGLLNDAVIAKRRKEFNEDYFKNTYTPRFMNEMLKPVSKAKLQKLAELSKTQDILIACYCTEENLCHRSIVKSLVDNINNNETPPYPLMT